MAVTCGVVMVSSRWRWVWVRTSARLPATRESRPRFVAAISGCIDESSSSYGRGVHGVGGVGGVGSGSQGEVRVHGRADK